MTMYRCGAVEVEARQLTRENGQLIWGWWKWADAKPWYDAGHILDGLAIWTRSGREKADFGDWIVKDADGFSVVKPDVFAAEYEPADQPGEEPATDLPRWEALYEPGNVSSYLIGYLNDEEPAKAAAIAWMRSQMLDEPGTLRWDEFRMDPARFGYDVEYRLREIDADGSETESGVLVQHRVADQSGEASP